MTVSSVTRRVPYRLFYRNLMSRLTFSNVPGKTYTCKPPLPPNGGGAFAPRSDLGEKAIAPFPPNGEEALTPLSHLGRGAGEEGNRFRRFTRDWIAERGDNLDIAWLKDDSDGGNDDLPEPAALAQEAMGELEAAMEELRGILVELGEEFEA